MATPTPVLGTTSCRELSGRTWTWTVSSLYTAPSPHTDLAVRLVLPRARLVTTPSSLEVARPGSATLHCTPQSAGPPAAVNWNEAPMTRLMLRGSASRPGYTVTGTGAEEMTRPA